MDEQDLKNEIRSLNDQIWSIASSYNMDKETLYNNLEFLPVEVSEYLLPILETRIKLLKQLFKMQNPDNVVLFTRY